METTRKLNGRPQKRKRNGHGDCRVYECGRPMHYPNLGLCEGHYARMRLGKVVNVPLRVYRPDGWRLLTDAALKYANADSRREFKSAEDALRYAARKWVAEQGRDQK